MHFVNFIMPSKCNIFLTGAGRGNAQECTDVRNAAERKSRMVEKMCGREGIHWKGPRTPTNNLGRFQRILRPQKG